MNVGQLLKRLGCPQPTASHHLGLLKMAGMVSARRQGKHVYYRLPAPPPAPEIVRVATGPAVIIVRL